MDSLTTLTYRTTSNCMPSLIFRIPRSPQHPLSLFQPAVSSLAVPWQRLLTVEILQLYALKSSLHRLPYTTHLIVPILFLITPRHGPSRKLRFQQFLYCFASIRCYERVYRATAQKLPSYIRPSRGRCPATGLHAIDVTVQQSHAALQVEES
jgi:hypothetical protein